MTVLKSISARTGSIPQVFCTNFRVPPGLDFMPEVKSTDSEAVPIVTFIQNLHITKQNNVYFTFMLQLYVHRTYIFRKSGAENEILVQVPVIFLHSIQF